MAKRIGYICSTNPFSDRRAWSGTIFKIREAIELAGFEIVWIPFDPLYKLSSGKKAFNTFRKIRQRISKKKLLEGVHSRRDVRRYASSIDRKIINECDYLFFPGGAQMSLFLKTSVPIIYLSDASVHQMIGYYWFDIDKFSYKIAKYLEKKASQKSTIIIRSSQWALDSVIKDCKCDRRKCFVLEFGANVDSQDISPNPVYEGGRLNILFSGVDWERKGGYIAVETVELLRKRGIDAHLLIAGIKVLPSRYRNLDYIEYWGFLNKNNPEEYKKYVQLYKKSHLLLLPTKAECSAIVFSESAAFGMPCYTFATGGTANYVVSDYNGYAFPVGSSPQDFADKIYSDITQGKMGLYHDNALNLYKSKLSWEAWATRFKSIMSYYT